MTNERELPGELFESFWLIYSDRHVFRRRFSKYEEACKAAEKLAAGLTTNAFFVMESRCLVKAIVTPTRRYAVSRDVVEQASEPT
jgi:hypothetical protein